MGRGFFEHHDRYVSCKAFCLSRLYIFPFYRDSKLHVPNVPTFKIVSGKEIGFLLREATGGTIKQTTPDTRFTCIFYILDFRFHIWDPDNPLNLSKTLLGS